jgi:hypothetical protein
MNIQNFEKARTLKDKIEQLKYLKEYLTYHFENDSIISVTTKTQIARNSITDTVIAQNSEWYGFPHIENLKEELDIIFSSIDVRIAALEKEFENL